MNNTTKRKAILFLILTALITVLLAAALPQLKLQQGIPLPWANSGTEAASQEANRPLLIHIDTFLATVLGFFVLLMLIYFVIRRRKQLNYQEIFQAFLGLGTLSLVLTVLLYALSKIQISLTTTDVEVLPPEIAAVPVVGPPLAPLPEFLLWLVWIGLAGLTLVVVILMARARSRTKVEAGQGDLVALEARQAVEAIKAGQDLSNVIIRCYEQMSQVLRKEQGLTLEETMTAREFEALLEKRGIPNQPVQQLTRLFEIARYAAQTPGPAEEVQAMDCLNAIMQYSQKMEPGQPE